MEARQLSRPSLCGAERQPSCSSIQSFLRGCTFRVRVGAAFSRIFVQEEGVPQGSVLSVTLLGLAISGTVHGPPPDIHCSEANGKVA